MSTGESIDITENDEDDIKERRPKPFRYIDNEDDIQKELAADEITNFTVMTAPGEAKIAMNEGRLASLENAEKIEDIIKKHEDIRKQNLEESEGYSIS